MADSDKRLTFNDPDAIFAVMPEQVLKVSENNTRVGIGGGMSPTDTLDIVGATPRYKNGISCVYKMIIRRIKCLIKKH